MFANAIAAASKAFFPIFRIVQNGSQTTINGCGCGFFVNGHGTFVATAHNFDAAPTGSVFQFRGRLPSETQNPPLVITEICRADGDDIYIGQINFQKTEFLALHPNLVPIGRSVCIAGYPLGTITASPTGFVFAYPRYFQPTFVLDHAACNVVSNSISRTHSGYFLRDFGLYGMSGGPVFDEKGIVIGVQASVTDPRVSIGNNDKISVRHAVVVSSDKIIALANQHGVHLGP